MRIIWIELLLLETTEIFTKRVAGLVPDVYHGPDGARLRMAVG